MNPKDGSAAAAAAILDYASPRPQSKLRLPARSVLSVRRREQDGAVEVVETLAGKAGAIGAIGFACFVLLVLGMTIVTTSRSGRQLSAVLIGTWLTEASLVVAVIYQTWRKTILHASAETMRLEFRAPMFRSRVHAWESNRVVSVEVSQSMSAEIDEATGQLEITICDHPRVVLFAGHEDMELTWIAELLREVVEKAKTV